MYHSRRHFLRAAAGAGLLGSLGDLRALAALSPATAAEATVTPDLVQLRPEIEPIVRLIEDTPREKCFDAMVEQLRRGLPYRQFLAALFLAGIRNVNPQPPGFKFHCVFVIHSAHDLSLDAPVQERLLPLFWALDNFKASQEEDVRLGDFRLAPVRGPLPSPERAWEEFTTAMDNWDEPAADRAVVALARSKGAHEVIEGLWRYGARDFRNIGHKAIFVANSWRTLQTIGWQHAEPTLRSLVLGLLDFGKGERVQGYAFEDQSYLANLQRCREAAGRLPGDWTGDKADAGVSQEVLAALRTATPDEACKLALAALTNGRAQAGAVWDAVHLAAGELMMRQPGIYGIHTVTSVNALRYAFGAASQPENRLLMLLQGLGWMGQFARWMAAQQGGLGDSRITEVPPAEISSSPEAAAEQILAAISSDPAAAARQAFRFAQEHPEPDVFTSAARRLIFTKGTDAHRYKYGAAIFEDYGLVNPQWRPHMLATSVYYLCGSGMPDSPLMQRAREAVKSLVS